MAGGAEVTHVADADVGGADAGGLVDGELHGGSRGDLAQAVMGVEDGGGGAFLHDGDVGAGGHDACLDAAEVDGQHSGDAVGVEASEVGVQEGVDGEACVVRWDTCVLE